MKKIDEIFFKTAVLSKGRMTEQSVKNAMEEYAKEYFKQQSSFFGVGFTQEQLQARVRLLDFAYNNCKEEDLKYLNEIRDSL